MLAPSSLKTSKALSFVNIPKVSSDLNVNEMLLEVLKKQDSLSKQIEKNAVSSGRGGPYVHRQLEDAPKSINADYGRGRDQTSYVPKEQRQMDQLISEAALEGNGAELSSTLLA